MSKRERADGKTRVEEAVEDAVVGLFLLHWPPFFSPLLFTRRRKGVLEEEEGLLANSSSYLGS